MPSPPHITTKMAYAVDDKTRPYAFFYPKPRTENEKKEDPAHPHEVAGSYKMMETKVHNARIVEPGHLSFDNSGFELLNQKTNLSNKDFYAIFQDQELKDSYYKEMEDFCKETFGCTHAMAFHHQIRNTDKSGQGQAAMHGNVAGYALTMPHTDSSCYSGDDVYLYIFDEMTKKENIDRYDPEKTLVKGRGRYVYLNIWRNISDQYNITNHHLACLDERSTIKPDDYIVKDLFAETAGYKYSVSQYSLNNRHHNCHKWYYYPNMTKDEVLVFKQADSDYRKTSRMAFHVAVEDPQALKQEGSDKVPARESIECRLLCIFMDSDLDTVPDQYSYAEAEGKFQDLDKEGMEKMFGKHA